MEMCVLKGRFQMIEAYGTVFYSVYMIALDCLSLVLYINVLNIFLGFFFSYSRVPLQMQWISCLTKPEKVKNQEM